MRTTAARTASFLLLMGLLGPRLGLGCGCGGPTPVCSVYWSTSLIFFGHVVRIEHVYDQPPEEKIVNGIKLTEIGPGQNLVHFNVAKSYRGAPAQQVVIHTPDQSSSCGYKFREGHDYLVYGYAAPNGELSAGLCARTHEVTSAAEDADIKWMEALPKSPPGASIFGNIVRQQLNEEGGYNVTALAGLTVSIKGPTSKTVSSDDHGNFRADGLVPGKYVVSTIAPSLYVPFPNVTAMVRDRGCAEVSWSTRLDGHMRGHVYFSDGTPAAGIYLTTKIANAEPHKPWTWQASSATSGADGAFDFAQLSPGLYVFAANMDFASLDKDAYYRKAFFPGVTHRSEAEVIGVGAGQVVDNLRFFLPPDSPPPSIPVQVAVLGFDGKPVPHADIFAYDDVWENAATPIMATADENGKATVALRPGSHYDIEASVDLPDFSQACAEPVHVDAHDQPARVVLILSHHFGNCLQFKKP